MRAIARLIARGLVWAVLAYAPAFALAQQGGTVREIVVEGAQRVEPDTVRSYLLVQVGDPFDPARIDRSLKSLFATGLFADVTLTRQGDRLVVNVVENPVINRIAFEGNQRITDETLQAEISLRPRVIYTRTKVQNDVKRILTLYRRNGRFAATVEPKVIQLPQNRVDLVYEISEGKLTEVQNIRFIGNKEFSDGRLRDVIRTKETRWYRFLSSDDTYDPDRLTLDRELLRRYYLARGYADFRVVSAVAELTPDRRDFFITFTLEEGPRYRFGKIDIDTKLRDLKPEQVEEAIEIDAGGWYDGEAVEKAVDRMSTAVGTLGYAFVEVKPRVNRDREKRTIDVAFEINEGPRVFVERIDISGNVRTLDSVVRREFRLVEGDAFNASKLRRSRQRIQNLDYFEKVNVEQLPGSAPDKTVVKVDVQEKSTGSLSLGAGFSTTYGPLIDVGIRERNLLGRGQDLGAKFVIAARQSQLNLNYTEPYFLDREVAAGVDLFHTRTNRQRASKFTSEVTGGALRAGYPITEHLTQNWTYSLRQSDVTDVAAGASQLIKDESGAKIASQVGHGILYDRRDSRVAPTDGYFVRVNTDFAGVGGDVTYLRNVATAGHYFPLGEQWVLGITGTGGYVFGIGENVRLLDRFFIGGDDLRGFATAGVGPRDVNSKDALGGEWKYTGTAELSFPLGLPNELGITGRVFSDIGSAGKLDKKSVAVNDTGSLRASIGTGIGWNSPLGLIGVDFAVPILSESFDDKENIRVNFGTRF